jgi:hypothetical protein
MILALVIQPGVRSALHTVSQREQQLPSIVKRMHDMNRSESLCFGRCGRLQCFCHLGHDAAPPTLWNGLVIGPLLDPGDTDLDICRKVHQGNLAPRRGVHLVQPLESIGFRGITSIQYHPTALFAISRESLAIFFSRACPG